MSANHGRVVVTTGALCHPAVHSIRIHHRDLPESWAQGESERDAAANLIQQLERSLDNIGSDRRRESLGLAIEDVRVFLLSVSVEPVGAGAL